METDKRVFIRKVDFMIIIFITLIICTHLIMEEIKEMKRELKEDIRRISINSDGEKNNNEDK